MTSKKGNCLSCDLVRTPVSEVRYGARGFAGVEESGRAERDARVRESGPRGTRIRGRLVGGDVEAGAGVEVEVFLFVGAGDAEIDLVVAAAGDVGGWGEGEAVLGL